MAKATVARCGQVDALSQTRWRTRQRPVLRRMVVLLQWRRRAVALCAEASEPLKPMCCAAKPR